MAQRTHAGVLTFLHADQVGGVRLTTTSGDTTVTAATQRHYQAFGADRERVTGVQTDVPTDWAFTGQREDDGTGLVYMHARYYDPSTGQFISPDSIVPEPGRIVAYNRYLYAYAEPLSFSDPTGMYSDQQIMTHFGCETWACVEAQFQDGGSLDGLWGWLEILKIAQDGDAIETKGWAGCGNAVSYTTMQGTFAIGAEGTIGVFGVSGQQDAFSPGRVDLLTWEAMVGDGFARLAAGMNAQGPMDGHARLTMRRSDSVTLQRCRTPSPQAHTRPRISRLVLRLWQVEQSDCRFLSSSLPPQRLGTMWSTSVAGAPHTTHSGCCRM